MSGFSSPGSGLSLGSYVATTSGAAIDLLDLKANLKALDFLMTGVSTTGSSQPIMQLGDDGGYETVGYSGSVWQQNSAGTDGAASAASTSGFQLADTVSAASTINGIVSLRLIDDATNKWLFSIKHYTTPTNLQIAQGVKSLSQALSQLRLTTIGGVETFDAGGINILTYR